MTIDYREKKYIAGIILIVTTLLYSYTYFNTFPVSEGWGIMYAEQIFQGKVPYRDFYYYLPPLNLLIDSIFWKLSFGYLIVYRFFWLCQRIVMQLLIFNLLNKFFSLKSSFLACFFAVFLCTANVYDLLGDYNQTMALLAVVLAYFTTAFAQAQAEREKYKHLFGAGFVLGLMFLTKQTIFLAAVIVHIILLTYFCLKKREKNIWLYCLDVIIGAAVPIAVAVLYLLVNGAFLPFIEEVFLNVDGKGSIVDILTAGFGAIAQKYHIWAIAGTGILCWMFILESQNYNSKKKLIRNVFATAVFFLTLLANYYLDVDSLNKVFLDTKSGRALLCLVIIPGLILLLLEKTKNRLKVKMDFRKVKQLYGCYSISCFLLGVFFLKSINKVFYNVTGLFTLIGSRLYPLAFVTLVVLLIHNISRYQQKEQETREAHIYLLGAAFSGVYAAMMGSGITDFGYFGTFLMIPLVCCYVFELSNHGQKFINLWKSGVAVVLLVLSMACVVEKTNCGYSWWGTVDEPLDVKTEMSDIKALKGVKLSEHQRELYDTITRLIKENSTEEDTIWTYPHMRLFNVLADNYTLDTFMPIVFYDVSADFYVEQETKLLSQNLPDIVVWEDIEYCKEVHEQSFRNGTPLKQREMEEMFLQKFDSEYTLVGVIDNFRVYKLNNGKPIRYRYGV